MKVLVIAPHADDETMGVGGTMAKYVRAGATVVVAVITGHGEATPHPLYPRESFTRVRGELRQACAILGVQEIIFEDVPAVTVADQPIWQLNRATRSAIERVMPDVLYVPFPFDLHKDHREIILSPFTGGHTCHWVTASARSTRTKSPRRRI